MKFCWNCNQVTSGEPLFCSNCGRSYDVKLCPKMHSNPRSAEFCSKCGSRDFSKPQPKVPLWARLALRTLPLVSIIVFVLFSAALAAGFIENCLSDPRTQGQAGALVLLLGLLWLFWLQVPIAIRKAIYTLVLRRRKRQPEERP